MDERLETTFDRKIQVLKDSICPDSMMSQTKENDSILSNKGNKCERII